MVESFDLVVTEQRLEMVDQRMVDGQRPVGRAFVIRHDLRPNVLCVVDNGYLIARPTIGADVKESDAGVGYSSRQSQASLKVTVRSSPLLLVAPG